jgi:hypothetical protein
MNSRHILDGVRSRLRRAIAEGRDRGSQSLEQIAITVGLLAIALGMLAGVGAAVAHYMGKL